MVSTTMDILISDFCKEVKLMSGEVIHAWRKKVAKEVNINTRMEFKSKCTFRLLLFMGASLVLRPRPRNEKHGWGWPVNEAMWVLI